VRRRLVKPLIYGYVRTPADAADQEISRIRYELHAFAYIKGFELGRVFYECPGSHDAFAELITELGRSEARHVIVPTIKHLADDEVLLRSMLHTLEQRSKAEVFELSDL
jgi:DNA invertase Pin-like site-specific DNA recombinase